MFNSVHPSGGAVSGNSGIWRGGINLDPIDLSSFLVPGETNRIVVIHADWCNNDTVLNGLTGSYNFVAPAITPVPALSEWGVFLMFLTIMCLGLVAFFNVQRRTAIAEVNQNLSLSSNLFIPFDQTGFMSALKMALIIVPVGFVLIYLGWGEIIVDDLIGMSFAIPIVAYLIYLIRWKE